jgi:hypothetical protein
LLFLTNLLFFYFILIQFITYYSQDYEENYFQEINSNDNGDRQEEADYEENKILSKTNLEKEEIKLIL